MAQPVLTPSAVILVLTIEQGGESGVHDLLSDLPGLARTVSFRAPEGGLAIVAGVARDATVVEEVHGFKYFDERDLLGFVDGTENPSGSVAAAAVSIGAEDSAFAGGSYLIVQKYLHDMAAWNALTVEDQERVIGRAKLSNVEMDHEVKPSNSHVVRPVMRRAAGMGRGLVRERPSTAIP